MQGFDRAKRGRGFEVSALPPCLPYSRQHSYYVVGRGEDRLRVRFVSHLLRHFCVIPAQIDTNCHSRDGTDVIGFDLLGLSSPATCRIYKGLQKQKVFLQEGG